MKRWLSYKGTCHVILLAKLHDMYLYKTDNFFHNNRYLKSVSKVAVLHRFYCTIFFNYFYFFFLLPNKMCRGTSKGYLVIILGYFFLLFHINMSRYGCSLEAYCQCCFNEYPSVFLWRTTENEKKNVNKPSLLDNPCRKQNISNRWMDGGMDRHKNSIPPPIQFTVGKIIQNYHQLLLVNSSSEIRLNN